MKIANRLSLAVVAVFLALLGWWAYRIFFGPHWVYQRYGTERYDFNSDRREVLDHGQWREEYSDEFYPGSPTLKK